MSVPTHRTAAYVPSHKTHTIRPMRLRTAVYHTLVRAAHRTAPHVAPAIATALPHVARRISDAGSPKQAPVFFWKRANCSSACHHTAVARQHHYLEARASLRNGQQTAERATSALVLAERWKMVAPRAKRREEMAMHVAVSTLSPVSIHTRTPALRSVSSVVLTRSCSLSWQQHARAQHQHRACCSARGARDHRLRRISSGHAAGGA
eukprot:1415993-Rhodomonas_salina.5